MHNLTTQYNNCKLICEHNTSFKSKQQTFGNTVVAQFTYHLASSSDFFPDIIEIEENNKKIILYGEIEFNGKKLKNLSDIEIQNIGFELLSQYAFEN